jgi:hypothetical protein
MAVAANCLHLGRYRSAGDSGKSLFPSFVNIHIHLFRACNKSTDQVSRYLFSLSLLMPRSTFPGQRRCQLTAVMRILPLRILAVTREISRLLILIVMCYDASTL